MSMDIHSLMRRLGEIQGAQVGHGPKHPVEPDFAIADEIAEFFKKYPALQHDQGYVNFLECYAGASISCEPELMVDIYGFVPGGSHIVKEDGYRLDESGYFAFCTIFLDNIKEIGFSFDATFDATIERKRGVYKWTLDENLQASLTWYCTTFLEWLDTLITSQGRFCK
jgi:hypothetical protein